MTFRQLHWLYQPDTRNEWKDAVWLERIKSKWSPAFPFQCPGLKISERTGKLPNKFLGLRDPKLAELRLPSGWWAQRWKWKRGCPTRQVVVSWSSLGTADTALLSIYKVDEHNETLPPSSACLALLTNKPEWLLALAAPQVIFPHAWKAPRLFLRLIRHKRAFHWHQSCMPAPSTSFIICQGTAPTASSTLCPTPIPKGRLYQGAHNRPQDHCYANSPCPTHRRAEEGMLSETAGLQRSVGCGMFSVALLWRAELRLQLGDG